MKGWIKLKDSYGRLYWVQTVNIATIISHSDGGSYVSWTGGDQEYFMESPEVIMNLIKKAEGPS